jgi:hypothetical protein
LTSHIGTVGSPGLQALRRTIAVTEARQTARVVRLTQRTLAKIAVAG